MPLLGISLPAFAHRHVAGWCPYNGYKSSSRTNRSTKKLSFKARGCGWATEMDDKSYSCCHPWVAFLQATDNVSRPLACCLQGVNQAGHPLSKSVFKTSCQPFGLPLSTPQPFNATIINWYRC